MQKVKEFLEKIKLDKLLSCLQKNPTLWTVVFIFALAFFLRVWQIDAIPGGFSEKEREFLNNLINLNKNKIWLGSNFDQAAYLYLAFLATKIFGLKIIILRILSAIIGSLTVLMLYVFIAKWFSRKIAIFAAFLLAISSFHITLSRLILPEIMLPLTLLLLFSLLTTAFRTKNIWYFGVSGLFLGMGFYTSPSFLLVPILFFIAGVYFFILNKKFFTSYKNEIIVSIVGFFASSLPFWVSFSRAPMDFLTNFGFNRSAWQVIMNIGQIPNLLFIATPREFFYNLGPEPLLDPLIFVTGILGFLFALFAITRRKYFFLVFWIIMFALYAALKRGVQIVDLIGLIVPIYVFSALILDYVLEKWLETFPYNQKARILVVAVVATLFAVSGLYNFDRFFVAYKNSPDVKKEFSATAPTKLK